MRKRIEEGIKQAELNYEAILEQGRREYEFDRQLLRDHGMTEEEIDDELLGKPEDEPKRGVEIDYAKGIFTVDGRQYTWEDIEAKWLENENFHGRRVNAEKVNRFFKLTKLANELKDGNTWVKGLEIDQPKKNNRFAFVRIVFSYVVTIHGNDLRRIEKMLALSDDFCMSAIKAGSVILTFGVKGVWE